MTRGIIYYTDSRIPAALAEPVRETIALAALPVVSCSLQPLAFGTNIVVDGPRGYRTYVRQIVTALETLTTDVVFFAEHDVLYHPSHWTFVPPRLDTWYYDTSVWRWKIGSPTAIRYDGMTPLSMACVGRATALDHYRLRHTYVERHPEQFVGRDPQVSRRWGYEPGKPTRRGGFRPERRETWAAEGPSLDIRHAAAFTPSKVDKRQFKHEPTGWQERPIEELPWSLSAIA